MDRAEALTAEIAAYHRGRGRGPELLAAFRRGVVVVAMAGGAVDEVLTVAGDGMAWLCAFTDLEKLARFAALRGDGDREWSYVTVTGARLLDRWLPGLPGPVGVALDPGGEHPMLFPPARGIVPDAIAIGP